MIIADYLRPPPERDPPTLDDPRWLLVRAALPLGRLLDAPPKALPLRLEDEGLLGILRLPTRSPPPALVVPRFVPALLVPRFAPAPVVPADAPERFAPAVPLRPAPLVGCVRAPAP